MGSDIGRTLVALSIGFALMWATVSMVAGPGSAALVALTGDLSHAGLFIALFYVAAAAGAALGGRLMDLWGRRPVLCGGFIVSAGGYALAGLGVQDVRLAAFIAGTLLLAGGFGVVNLTRVAAAEMFEPARRARGVAWVQVSATVGAVVGPLLLIASGPLGAVLDRQPLSLVWWLAPPLLLVAAVVVLRADEPMGIARRLAVLHPTSTSAHLPPGASGLVVAGVVSLASAQAAMAALMGVAGAAVGHAGHPVETLGVLMFVHFVGMFGLSRMVGRVADAAGRRVTILLGLALLVSGGIVTALEAGIWMFGVGLLLAGFGWSFAFIGATVLLTDATAPERRARVMGRADLGAQGAAAIVAMGGGYWFAANGMAGLGVVAAAVALVPMVVWLFVHEPRPGASAAPAS